MQSTVSCEEVVVSQETLTTRSYSNQPVCGEKVQQGTVIPNIAKVIDVINFDNDVTITVIEQIRKDHLTIDRKKELLRNREMFWQRMLNSIQPNGLNKRMIKIEYPTMMPFARRIQKDTKRLDSGKLIRRMKK